MRCRARSRRTPASRITFKQRNSSSWGSTTTCACRICCVRSRSNRRTQRHANICPSTAPPSSLPVHINADPVAHAEAVVFDVDFTLIYPGPVFRGAGYHAFSKRYGIEVDPEKFESAVVSASSLLDDSEGSTYDHELF